MKFTISQLKAYKILNSGSNWTIETQIKLSDGTKAKASVPQGISTGKQEKAVVTSEEAIKQINDEIFPLLKGKKLDQENLDTLLTEGNWGGNATLAVSACFAKASGFFKSPVLAFPKIMMLIFEGKKHGNPSLTIQEFMVIVDTVEEGVDFYQKTKQYLAQKRIIATVGSEGGFSPPGFSDEDILSLMEKLKTKKIALDVAANTNPPSPTTLLDIVRRYPIASIEDPLPENEPEEWGSFFEKARKINPQILIVADDLTVTDSVKIKRGVKEKLFNAVIIKPNQQGTISQATKAVKTAKNLGIKTIVSHRGEETNDDWIVDFALRVGSDFVKFGAPSRGERIAKYNKLLQAIRSTTT
jgi:enolase